MDIATIDHIPSSSRLAASIDTIAICDNLNEIKGLVLPAKVDLMLLILCERGTLTLYYDSSCQKMAEHNLMVLRPGHILHRYVTSPDFKGHFISISSSLLGDMLPPLAKTLPCFTHFRDNPVIALNDDEVASQTELRDILRRKTYSQGHQYQGEVVRTLLEALFYETLGLYLSHWSSVDNTKEMKRRDALFYSFICIVEENFRTERSVSFYADKLCISPKHLSATIKEASGRTASEWIDSYVILEAKTLLRNTGLTIQEVSTKLNFTNQSFFGKYFKHLTGQSPRAFHSSPQTMSSLNTK